MRYRPEVTVYTRIGCGLCATAEKVVLRESRRGWIAGPRPVVEVIDVDREERLVQRYGVRVPVITVDDVEVAEFEVTREQVRDALRAARRAGR